MAQSDELTGQAIVAFVTLRGELEGTPEFEAEIREHVAAQSASSRGRTILDRRPAQDELREDHAAAAARHRGGPALGDVTTLRDPTAMVDLARRVAAAQAI